MAREIFNIKGMAESMRYTEYKNIYSAISEIVDNSIEAKARDVVIILKVFQEKGREVINRLAILDNGTGMDDGTLQDCLVFGSSTKKDRQSMGRFGVGLGQASLFAAPRVEVFSWQNNDKQKKVYLDTDLMSSGRQNEIPTPFEDNFPDEFSTFKSLNYYTNSVERKMDFSNSGTMIVWDKVDKISVKASTFKTRLSEELGRKFRYYINSGVNIFITDTAYSFIDKVSLIDSMFLMEKSRYLGSIENTTKISEVINSGEPIFELFDCKEAPGGEYVIHVAIDKRNEKNILGDITIRASIVKEKFYYGGSFNAEIHSNPGNTEVGKLLRKYENISVLRAKREIQYDKFGLYESVNKPTNRWWSIEIEFPPSLDEFFKLSNNKQKVEIVTSYYDSFKEINGNRRVSTLAISDYETAEEKYWIEIVAKIRSIIRSMTSRNSKIANLTPQKPRANDGSNLATKEIDRVYQPFEKTSESDFSPLLETVLKEEIDKVAARNINESVFNAEIEADNSVKGLFMLERDDFGNIKSKINYDSNYFLLKNVYELSQLDEKILYLFVQGLSNMKKEMKTFESRKNFEDFSKYLNKEIDSLLKQLLEKENYDGH